MQLDELIRYRAEADKRSGYTRRRADKRHFRPDWIKSQPGRVFFGGEAITIEKRHLKYVAHWAPYFPYTAGELARLYLDNLLASTGLKRVGDRYRMSDIDREALAIPAPLFFDPSRGRDGHFVYIDIQACYFQLMRRWPLNIGYNLHTGAFSRPRPALRIPEADIEWLLREKPIRHALFGMLAAGAISWYKDGQFVSHDTLGNYGAPDLHALVKQELHRIARAAVDKFGCYMWLTDAAIFPLLPVIDSKQPYLLFGAYLASQGLSWSVKANGKGHLYAFGDYQIGRVSSAMGHIDLPGISNLGSSGPSTTD